jgi:hypothetical protein
MSALTADMVQEAQGRARVQRAAATAAAVAVAVGGGGGVPVLPAGQPQDGPDVAVVRSALTATETILLKERPGTRRAKVNARASVLCRARRVCVCVVRVRGACAWCVFVVRVRGACACACACARVLRVYASR